MSLGIVSVSSTNYDSGLGCMCCSLNIAAIYAKGPYTLAWARLIARVTKSSKKLQVIIFPTNLF